MSMNPAKRNRNSPLLKISGEEASYASSACSFPGCRPLRGVSFPGCVEVSDCGDGPQLPVDLQQTDTVEYGLLGLAADACGFRGGMGFVCPALIASTSDQATRRPPA